MKVLQIEKVEKLSKAIRNGDLKVNKRNADAVRSAYLETLFWNKAFKEAGLSHLPDPEGIMDPQVFLDWLVKAYREKYDYNSEDEARNSIRFVLGMVFRVVEPLYYSEFEKKYSS
jgi:hypothetical protein